MHYIVKKERERDFQQHETYSHTDLQFYLQLPLSKAVNGVLAC